MAILESLLVNSSNQKILAELYNLTDLENTNTQFLKLQTQKIKPYYQSIMIEDLSASRQKFLYFILEDLGKGITIQEELYIGKCIKEKIKKYIEKNKKNDLSNDDLINLTKEIEFPGFKSLDKQNNIFSKMKQTIYRSFSESEEDGTYGIKILKEDKNIQNIHIFVNGFTNDKKGNNFEEWLEQSEELLLKDTGLYGYDWPSGKIGSIVKLISKAVSKAIFKSKGNWIIVLGTLSASLISEWKQARDNSEKYASGLASFIKEKYEKNPNTKIHLYGHSLGARLVYFTLENLSNANIEIEEVFFFGGAVHIDDISATDLLRFTKKIYNFYSYNDDILRMMYKGAELFEEPIGLNYIYNKQAKEKTGTFYNFNVSEFIGGHTEYIDSFSTLYRRKYRCEEYL